MKYSKYNVVIIGSGLAGLYLANRLADKNIFQDGILLLTKEELFSGSTSLAQGGIVSVIPEINKSDSIESHVKDTIAAGCGLNNINTVKFVSENSSAVTQELIRMGVEFDKNEKNIINFTLEGAHCVPRILHANGDSTGKVIEKALCEYTLKCNNLDIYTNTLAIEILTDNSNCAHGVIAYNKNINEFEAIFTNNIVLATGGIGQLYKNTTNPKTQTADGIALAIKAGAEVSNMEFVQFHPTGLYAPNNDVVPLISESVRGEGAKLVNLNGEYFAKKYHPKADLAPRDVVARAIYNEMKLTGAEYVNLDISQMGIEKFKKRFPTITELCNSNNIDLSSGLIPVAPVQHYFMGGIKTDINSKTTIKNLYAIGECAMTGLHGANRLASNSLLECAVFAHNLADYIAENSFAAPNKHDKKIQEIIEKYTSINIQSSNSDEVKNMQNKLKSIMTENVGISRNRDSLLETLAKIENMLQEAYSNDLYSVDRFELISSLIVSKSITEAAIARKESIGAHYRLDSSFQEKNTTTEIGNNDNEKLLA